MPELRHDPLSGRLVLVSPARDARPQTATWTAVGPAGAECPFCAGHEAMTPPEVARTGPGAPDTTGWRTRVVPNLYPIVGGPDADTGATGAHEVVVLSPAHDAAFDGLTPEQAVEVLTLLRDRVRAHLAAGHAFALALVNQGHEAGASLVHPHAQVVALDFVPPAVESLVARFEVGGTDLVAASADDAAAHGCMVGDGPARVWCPFASGTPYTMLVAHDASGPGFHAAEDAEIADVALALRSALARLRVLLGAVPYNVVVHTVPPGREAPLCRWHVEVLPRVAVAAGFEEGTGVLVNTVPPERAAARLREAQST